MKILNSLAFDDVLLIPQYSDITSRNDVDISSNLGKIKLNIPIISSPMDTVTEENMASVLHEMGGLGVIHRYMSIEKQWNIILNINEKLCNKPNYHCNVGFAVGVTGDYLERTEKCYIAGGNVVCVDVAHGHHSLVAEAINNIKKLFPDLHVMAGNVATSEAYMKLSDCGADSIRCGVGSGCFISGTKITTKDGYKNIENIKIGDIVLTHNGEYKNVYQIFEFDNKNDCILLNNETVVTQNHEYLVVNKKYENIITDDNYMLYAEWISAGELTSDYLLIEIVKMKLIPIKSVEKIVNTDKKYDFSVEDNHSYIANDVIVHNSICSTRLETGHGVPVLQTIIDCEEVREKHGYTTKIIADGGVRTAGDIVKALAAGADFCMLGSLLAGTSESPGDVLVIDGEKWKIYRGMASKEAQFEWKKDYSSNEGISTKILYKGDLNHHLTDILFNIKSGLSYSGARNIQELRIKAKWMNQTMAGQIESSTHILRSK